MQPREKLLFLIQNLKRMIKIDPLDFCATLKITGSWVLCFNVLQIMMLVDAIIHIRIYCQTRNT